MANNEKKVSVIVDVIDKVAGPIRAINTRIAGMVAPARAASRAMNGLMAESGLKRVAAAAGNVGKQFGNLKRTMGQILGVVGAATGALAGLFYALKRNADAGDQAVKASQRFGLTITDWQRLAYAGDLANLSTEHLGAGLRTLNKNAVAAATGNKTMALWFQRAGVSVTDANGKMRPTSALLADLADRFAAMPDGPKKTALAMALMSESGEKMIPLLNGGAKALRAAGNEAEALGLVDAKLAKDQELFNDNVTTMQRVLQGAFNIVAKHVLPVLNEIIPKIKEWFIANRELIDSKVKEFVDGIKERLPEFIRQAKDVLGIVWGIAKAVNGVAQFFGGWGTVISVLAGLLAGKMIWSVIMLTKSIATLGLVTALTPFGIFMTAVGIISGLAYLLWKNWDWVKDAFAGMWDGIVDAFKAGFEWIKSIILKIDEILPAWMKKGGLLAGVRIAADSIRASQASAVGSAVAPSAVAPGGGSTQVNGAVTVKVETAPGVRARVTDQRASGGIDLGVETGYAMAGA